MNQRTRVTSGRRDLYAAVNRDRIPLWISASNYYVLVVFAAAALFLIVWASLHDGYDDTPLIVAGIAAITFLSSLVLFREVVLRRYRGRALAARRLSHQLRLASGAKFSELSGNKISLQRNDEMLRDIRTKSDAAKVLGKLADAHKEVVDLCQEYLAVVTADISAARVGSPRIPVLRKGLGFASRRHRSHMLKWAEIKARSFTSEANNAASLSDKIQSAEEALSAVETAIEAYPAESTLVDSRGVLLVFLVSAKVKNSVEKAERADARGNHRKAVDHYSAALDDLKKYDIEFPERSAVYERIRSEMSRISKLANF